MSRLCVLLYSLILFVAYTLIFSHQGHAANDERQVYIVYMGALPQREQSSLYSSKISEFHINLLQQVVDSSFVKHALVRSYSRTFNAFAANLTDQEQQTLTGFDEVISVFPSRTYWPQTTRSWDFMGLTQNITINPSSTESDIIIGVIDSGIWPESKSFNDEGFTPIPKKWKGVCNGGKNFTCNNKLIGARYYKSDVPGGDSARDTTGHGTHTASIAAGNYVNNASFFGIAEGTARGGVPSARIAVYKVCYERNGCKSTDILAAFGDAIADGVDLITISVGATTAVPFFLDTIAIGALHAFLKGILTVQAAGNNGFSSATVTSVAPWLLTVGASSTDRKIVTEVALGNGKTMVGRSVNSFKMNGTKFPLVYGKDVTSRCNEAQAKLCLQGCLNSSLIRGKIVVCDRMEGIDASFNAGALGSIAQNGIVDDSSVIVPLPASALSTSDMETVRSYIDSAKTLEAYIATSRSDMELDAPVVASFSSKGPNPIFPEILKPDITAPGVDILAAYPPVAPVSTSPYDKRSVEFKTLSGTSMSCPHAAGATAYVKSKHPNWSPSAIKSALMTTAWPMDAGKHKDAEFSYGAGHINPVNATDPGLVYEMGWRNYAKMACKMGFATQTVQNMFADNSIVCPQQKLIGKYLNYPSMTAQIGKTESFSVKFRRTVKNVGVTNSTYKAEITNTWNCSITVKPDILSFNELNQKKSFDVVVEGHQMQSMISASLVWSDGIHFVRSPIVLY